jgi:tetratricopeptide (TPR) repeat protein
MISSTARDLPKHRDEVRLACERAGFEPREMMENLPALNNDAVEISLRMVEQADVYLGIFAYRYGTIRTSHERSITEMEYDHAVEVGKPRLIFFIHKDHSVVIDDVETGPGAEKLKALKDRIGEQRVAAFFKSPEDLRSHVVEALTALTKEFDAAAIGDPTASVVAQLHRRISIPAPPEHYIAHPYMLMQHDLVGREAELNFLTDWVANPAMETVGARVFCIVAIGGMGKSALTWKWFNHIAANEMKPLAGRLWWSFYEGHASFENFLIRALCYVSEQGEEEVRRLPWQDREAQRLRHLNEKSYLFVLDGLERLLIAYHRMDARYLADDDYDQQTANFVAAAGLPSSAAQSFMGQHRLRQTTDPRAGAFLQKLSQIAQSHILITTRLYPSALQLPNGKSRPGCFAYFLRGLRDNDALGLWRALNAVEGSRAELLPILRSVENHPLLVQALASEVANYRRAPGDFAQWRADHPQFDPTSLPLVQSQTHILEFALSGLSPKMRGVLHTLVRFLMPASYAVLEALLVGSGKACGSAQELDLALTELEDRGLIGWDREANRYDAHPIVRGVVWQLTDSGDQRAVYTALEAHLEPMVTPEWDQIETLADLTPAIERYHTLVGLKRYEDAFALFCDRLDDATLYRLAAHQERIAWLERLFPDGAAGLPALKNGDDRGYVLNSLAASYDFSGQPARAVSLLVRADQTRELSGDVLQRPIRLSNLGKGLLEIGALREAVGVLRQALALSRLLEEEFPEGISLRMLGFVLGSMGAQGSAQNALRRSQRLFIGQGLHQSEGVAGAYLAELKLWGGDLARAGIYADRAWELASVQKAQGDSVRAALLQGRVALSTGELSRADERLHYALTRSRAVNVVEFELSALIAIAELELTRGDPAKAKASLDDVWDAAQRGPYPFHLADAFNVLTAIVSAEGDDAAAIAAATNAFKAAWCDGPPYAYHWGLEKAKAHLVALGAPEVVLPRFDESKFGPLPKVEINPRVKNKVESVNLNHRAVTEARQGGRPGGSGPTRAPGQPPRARSGSGRAGRGGGPRRPLWR